MKKLLTLNLILSAFFSFSQKQSQERIDSLLTHLPKSQGDTSKVNLLVDIGYTYSFINSPEGLNYSKQALAAAEKLNWKKGIAYANISLGENYRMISEESKALENFIYSLKLFEELGDKRGIAKAFTGIGRVYYSTHHYSKSMENVLSALRLSEELGDKELMATNLKNIGLIYSDTKDFHKALDYFLKALKLGEEIGDKTLMEKTFMSIAYNYDIQSEYAKALEYSFKSLEMSIESGHNPGRLQNFMRIGNIYFSIAQDSSKIQLNKIFRGNKSKALQQAKIYIDSTIALCKQLQQMENLPHAYQLLSEIQALSGDSKGALENLKLSIIYRDSFNLNEKSRSIAQIQIKFDREKLEAASQAEMNKQKAIRNGFVGGFAVVLIFAGVFFRQRNKTQKEKLRAEEERKRSEELLLNILPGEVADEIKSSGTAKAKAFTMVTVMFTDFKDFTTVSEKISAELLVEEIHTCFSAFDNILNKYKIEKIKTIGDAYLCASGLPVSTHTHAQDMMNAALEIRSYMLHRKKEKETKGEIPFELRIGVHTGPVVAGVVGIRKYAYDIWGDTVNIAARMEQNSEAGEINISGSTYELVKDKFKCEHRGKISAKNKGEIDMYFVEAVL